MRFLNAPDSTLFPHFSQDDYRQNKNKEKNEKISEKNKKQEISSGVIL